MRISIIGLGWLGEPLAKILKAEGFQISGSTSSQEKKERLQESGFEVARLSFIPHPQGVGFHKLFDTDILFINIPPRTRTLPSTHHPEQIKFVKEMAVQAGVKKIIYISATSVYPDQNRIARETDILTEENTGNPALYRAEHILSNNRNYDLTIVRFGGLLGVDRIPGRYFSGKENVVGDTPVNYIHRDDACEMIRWLIKKDLWNEVFNGVAPEHPWRKEVYEKNASEMGFIPPIDYAPEGSKEWKEISAEKILRTGFSFQYPNPLDFSYQY
jgi:nucleoside-diphosphate-sugar epimerase